MPRLSGGALGEVTLVQGGNTAIVGAASATLDEALAQYIAGVVALYAFDGSLLSRLEVESAASPNLKVGLYEGENKIGQGDTPADGLTIPTTILDVLAHLQLFNGTTSDRERGNEEKVASAAAAKTATFNTAAIVNYNGRGVHSFINVTAVSGSSPTLNIKCAGYDFVNSTYVVLEDNGALVKHNQMTSTATFQLVIYPGITKDVTSTGVAFNMVLPRRYQWQCAIGGSSPSFTFGIADHIIR